MKDIKINEDAFQNQFVFKTDWKVAFEDPEFVKVFSSDILESYIVNKRWYGGKASTLKYIEVVDWFKMTSKKNTYYGVLLEVNFKEAFYQNYFMPISFMKEEELDTNTIIAPVKMNGIEGFLVDALHQEDFKKLMFDNIVASGEKTNNKLKFHKGQKLLEKESAMTSAEIKKAAQKIGLLETTASNSEIVRPTNEKPKTEKSVDAKPKQAVLSKPVDEKQIEKKAEKDEKKKTDIKSEKDKSPVKLAKK